MEKTSKQNTQSTSVSVLMINSQGFMVTVQGCDYFISYNRCPWMKNASINDILNDQMDGDYAIGWPTLDTAFEIDSLKHPERYPFVMNPSNN